MNEKRKINPDALINYASSGTLKFCGSLIAISMAFRIVGFDAAPLVRAWEQHLINDLSEPKMNSAQIELIADRLDEQDKRLQIVESVAHEPSKKDAPPK